MKINQKFTSNTKSIRSEVFKFFRDILRDKNSNKYSLTKTVACLGVILLIIIVIFAIIIMVRKNEVDHILIVEVIGFILTLLGFKNSFGYATNGKGEQQIVTKNNMEDSQTNDYYLDNNSNNNNDVGNTGDEKNQSEIG